MSDWSRLHPLTPVLRGGRYVLALLAVFGQQGARQADLRALVALMGLGVPLAVLAGVLSWRATRYRLEGVELQVRSGVLRRQDRRVPLARVQSVDIVRPLVGRLLGLAELRLEVVGGSESEARLAYLREEDATSLRAELLRRAAGQASGQEGQAAEGEVVDEEGVLVAVPTGALVGSALLGTPAVVFALTVAAVVGAALVDPSAGATAAAASLPLLLAAGGLPVRRVLAEYGFRVSEVPGGLRLRHGLLDRRTQTIPGGRVQSVRVREPLLWRSRGWVRTEVDVAGYAAGRGEEQAATSALLPVAPRELASALVARVLGGAVPVPSARVPRRARWRAPLAARRLAAGRDEEHVAARSGAVTAVTDVVPLAKVQSLRLTQGPWQRRLGLASVHVDTAGRRLPGAVLAHRDADEAVLVLDDLVAAARAARQR